MKLRGLGVLALTGGLIGGDPLPFDPSVPGLEVFLDVSTAQTYTNFTNSIDLFMSLEFGDANMSTYNCYLTVVNLANGQVLKDAYKTTSSYNRKLKKNTVSCTIPFQNNLTSSGFQVTIKLATGTIVGFEKTFNLYPSTSNTFHVGQDGRVYSHSGRYLSIQSSAVSMTETFDFTNTLDEISTSEEGRLDFSELSFTFTSPFSFSCLNSQLVIVDTNNVYKLLPHTNNRVTFELNTVKSGSTITFTPKDTMYVNTQTHDMSAGSRVGYSATTDIYVPVGCEELLKAEDMYIVIYGAGKNNDMIYIPLSFTYEKAQVGSCHFSDICIIGGVIR